MNTLNTRTLARPHAAPRLLVLLFGLSAALAASAQSSLIETPATVRSLQFENPTLSLALGPRTHVVYEPRPQWWADPHTVATGAPAEARLGLEFRTISAATGAENLLRVQLSGGGALQFRPRSGGMAVAYRCRF
jgi:hypothetical protein